jgi:hypothetical protein
MRRIASLFAAVSLTAAAACLAQGTAGGEPRGTTPPGMGRDGSRPADGAIQAAPPESDSPRAREEARCRQLAGALREQCLREVGARNPDADPRAAPAEPARPSAAHRDAAQPPPQNPSEPG